MSWFELLETQTPKQGKVTKISPDGKKISVQTGPGQTMNLDLNKDPNIDVSSNGGKTSIKLNHDNKSKLKKPGGAKPGQTVSIESKSVKEGLDNDDTRNIAIRCVDEMVKEGLIANDMDTDGDTEFQIQDIIHDQINKALSVSESTQKPYVSMYRDSDNKNKMVYDVLDKHGNSAFKSYDEDEATEYFKKNYKKMREATHSDAKPIYDLVGSLGAGKIELAQNPIFHNLVRFLDAGTIEKFVADFRKKLDNGESVKEAEVTVNNEGNIAGYLNTIDEYVEMLADANSHYDRDEAMTSDRVQEIAYRIQNAVDDIRMRELGLKPSNIRSKFNEQITVQKKRLVDTGLDLEEGPQDKHIFKAVFMAGGPGSGKSFVAQKVLKQFGLKVIDSDKMFEHLMAKRGMDVGDPEQIYSPDGQATRDHGKELMAKQKGWWLDGKLGVVIDGTGRDVEKTAKIRQEMINQGYGTMMLFVNTKLAVAQERNLQRPRKLPILKVEQMWRAVQENIMKFQQLFGADRFIVIDNSGGLEDPGRAEAFTKVESSLRKFLTAEPRNKVAQNWIKQNKK